MREKIAQAIFDVWAESVGSESTWEDVKLMNGRPGYGEAKRIYKLAFDEADAVLDALMSPSANMIDEGIDADENSFDGLTQVATIFTAMIQAAKEGGDE